jgi:hypothetical protein
MRFLKRRARRSTPYLGTENVEDSTVATRYSLLDARYPLLVMALTFQTRASTNLDHAESLQIQREIRSWIGNEEIVVGR